MRTAIIIFLYALLFFLLFLLVTAGCYFSKFIKRRELAKAAVNAADVEVNFLSRGFLAADNVRRLIMPSKTRRLRI
jgi:hypothetical protein